MTQVDERHTSRHERVETLEGAVALVTGGGRGLGAAICETLAAAGAIAVPLDIRQDLADQVADRIAKAGGRADPLTLDVADADQCEAGMRRVFELYGRLDVLINNAGVDVTVSVEELTVEQWDRIMAVNLRAPFVLSRLALPRMRAQGHGHIVNIISTAAKRAWPNASAYHASKSGLLAFSHALHVEARQHGVKVTAVVSGGMRTPFLLDRFPELDPNVLQDPKTVAETVRFVLTMPGESVVPEVMVLPMRETSWP